MAKTPGQRGTFGAWLWGARSRRYETQRDALTAMEKLAGLKIAPSEYAQWESGSRVPNPDNPKVARLYDFFGSKPEEPSPEPPAFEGASAIAALAAAIGPLTDELRYLRAEREGALRRIADLELAQTDHVSRIEDLELALADLARRIPLDVAPAPGPEPAPQRAPRPREPQGR